MQNSKKSFFTQFNDFSTNLEKDVKKMKFDFQRPPGSYPQNYYKGLEVLRTDISELKNLNNEAREKVKKIKEFSSDIENVQKSIDSYNEKITNLEVYFEKFGYQIPKFEDPTEDIDTPEVVDEQKDEKKSNPMLMTPELSEVGKKLLFKRVDAEQNSINDNPTSKWSGETSFHTPPSGLRDNVSWSPQVQDTAVGPSSAVRRVQRWIEGVDAAGGPATLSTIEKETKPKRRPLLKPISLPKDVPKKDDDLETPPLSHYEQEKKTTLNSPQLSSVLCDINAKVLSTPETPKLSDFTQKFIKEDRRENCVSKKAVLNVPIATNKGDPITPELSRYGQEILKNNVCLK